MHISQARYRKTLRRLCLHLQTLIRSPTDLLFQDEQSQLSASHSKGTPGPSASLWPPVELCIMLSSLLYWGAQNWPQNSRCSLTSPEQCRKITSLDLLVIFCLMQPRIPLDFLVARAHCWLRFNLVSGGTPRSSSAGLRPAGWPLAYIYCWCSMYTYVPGLTETIFWLICNYSLQYCSSWRVTLLYSKQTAFHKNQYPC